MTQMYGHRFTSAWGSEDSGVWQKIIFSFSTFIVTEALCFLLNKDHPFMEFPPNPMQFRKLCEQIKAEHAPRKTSKLTSPCDVCGQPGRIPSDPNSKSTKALCYQHYCESRFPMKKELSQWWKDFYKTWTLDKSEIRKILEARNYKSDIEREIENLYHYHKLKVNQAEESVKQAKHNYENG